MSFDQRIFARKRVYFFAIHLKPKKKPHFSFKRIYWQCSSFLHSQERKRKCICSVRQYMFRCFHMGRNDSYQYRVSTQECRTLHDRIGITLFIAHYLKYSRHTATLPETFIFFLDKRIGLRCNYNVGFKSFYNCNKHKRGFFFRGVDYFRWELKNSL